MVKTEVSLRHEIVTHILLAVFFSYTHTTNISRMHLFIIIFHCIREGLKGSYRVLVNLTDNIIFRFKDT